MQRSRKAKKKRWEGEIIDFLKPEETDSTKGSEIKNNDTWIRIAKQNGKWKEKEDEFAAASKKMKTESSSTEAKQQITGSSKDWTMSDRDAQIKRIERQRKACSEKIPTQQQQNMF